MPPELQRMPLSTLIYGESKSGKSLTAVSTAAPRVLFDSENAAQLLPIRPVTWNPANPIPEFDGTWDTAVIPVQEFRTAELALEKLYREPHQFRSVVVDSISEAQWALVDDVSGGDQTKLQDWGVVYRRMGRFCRRLRDLTAHPTTSIDAVVVTAMTKDKADTAIAMPFLQGQMKDVIPYLFDVFAYIEKKEEIETVGGRSVFVTNRYLHTRETSPKRFAAGDRVSGRIVSPLKLPVVTGRTVEEIAAANNTYQKIQMMVWRDRHKTVITTPEPIPAPATEKPARAEKESA